MLTHSYDPKTNKLTRISPLPTRVVIDCSIPEPAPSTAPHTEMVVQVTLSLQAHRADVREVLDRLQAAIKDATVATGGRIAITFAMPDIVRETTIPRDGCGSVVG